MWMRRLRVLCWLLGLCSLLGLLARPGRARADILPPFSGFPSPFDPNFVRVTKDATFLLMEDFLTIGPAGKESIWVAFSEKATISNIEKSMVQQTGRWWTRLRVPSLQSVCKAGKGFVIKVGTTAAG